MALLKDVKEAIAQKFGVKGSQIKIIGPIGVDIGKPLLNNKFDNEQFIILSIERFREAVKISIDKTPNSETCKDDQKKAD